MDKETLSNYGWIVICVLVLAVMVALATPFGTYVSDAVETTTQGLFDVEQNALDAAGIKIADQSFEGCSDTSAPDPALNPSGIVPEGATYTAKDGTVYNAGDTMPAVQPLDAFRYGDYKYYCVRDFNGWNVSVLDKTKTEYGAILESINGQPIVLMSGTFDDCTNLKIAPTIPSGVIYMGSAFYDCVNLTTAPIIPNGVTNLTDTFMGCTSLTTAPVIPNSVTNMCNTFNGCTKLTTAPVIPNSVTNMQETFSGCTSLKTYAGSTDADGDFLNYVIPSSVENMSYTFWGCTSLKTAPTIPNSVTDMTQTFRNCTSLTGDIEINANPTSYSNCFDSTTQPIKIIGSCGNKAALAATATNNNVTY